MKYIINEHQYKLLLEQEEEILSIPFALFNNDWDDLQKFLEKRGFPPYEITGDLDLRGIKVESLGNLISVGGALDLADTPLSKKYTKEEIRSMVKVGGEIYL
jgi:hypothetical protein